MAQTNETLSGLDALIAQAQKRLSQNPEYIALKALEKARAEIVHQGGRPEKMVDDQTGEVLELRRTGRFAATRSPSQLEAAKEALATAGEPLTTPQMVERVRALGATVGGRRPNINLGSTLSRSEDLKSVRWHGEPAWWFKSRPVPEKGLRAAE